MLQMVGTDSSQLGNRLLFYLGRTLFFGNPFCQTKIFEPHEAVSFVSAAFFGKVPHWC
jgi:hypothetical protein